MIRATRYRYWLWLIRIIGVIVPRRLRADWKQEWEAELRNREALLAEWANLNWKTKLDLLRRSVGAFRDALLLQPRRLEDEMFQDLRHGLRMLLKGKAFTAVAVISLALGIGANTAIFTLLDAILLKSLPVREPEKLVLFGRGTTSSLVNEFPNKSWDNFSYPFYREVRQRNQVFSNVAAIQAIPWTVHGIVNTNGSNGASGEMEKIDVQLVSGSYFSTLGVNAGLGRLITDDDDRVLGEHPVAVISHDWWERRLGGDPAALGKTITIDKIAYTIIGVAPKGFYGAALLLKQDLWIPLAMEEKIPPGYWKGRENKKFQVHYLIGRLKNGVSAQQASADVNLLFKQFLQEWTGPQPSAERLGDIQRANIELTPAGKGLPLARRWISLSLRILMAVVVAVLLIACANIANLLLARAASRQREFAVRMAMGAGRTRLIRQLLTESLLLAGLGAAGGIVLAYWGSRMLLLMASYKTDALPLDITPNSRILGFTLLASLFSALIFGTAPALRAAGVELTTSLKGGKAQTASQSRFGKALVVAQVALSLLLLVGAGLFVRTLLNLQKQPTGFKQENVLLFHTDVNAPGEKDAKRSVMLREIEEKLKAIPGVQAASFCIVVFGQGVWTTPIFSRDFNPREGERRFINDSVVGPDYFTAMGIPLIEGRTFGPQDTDKDRWAAVISESLARQFFPNGSPLGKRFGVTGPQATEQFEIIGVVKDAKYVSLSEDPQPTAYYSHSQAVYTTVDNLVVRYSGSAEAVIPQIRRTIHEVNRNLPIDGIMTLSDHIGLTLARQKLVARLAAFFSLLALLLACVGLYGVLSYAVARRTNEIGTRMALGAQRGDVIRLVLRESLTLVVAGVVIGLLASLTASHMVSTMLYGLKPNDPLTIAAATLLLLAAAALAGYLPARRATRVDPMAALRDE